ncbi:hypothetical protein [Streptomyces sp. NPDC003480]
MIGGRLDEELRNVEDQVAAPGRTRASARRVRDQPASSGTVLDLFNEAV